MATRPYIPNNNKDFNDFQNNINTEVTTNAVAWGIPAAQVTLLNNWNTGYTPVYTAIVNVETRMRQQVLAHKEYRGNYVAFLRPFCQSFLTNNILIPVDQRVALGLNPRGVNPPSERPDILTAPVVQLQPLGGGKVRFGFKVAQSNKRTGRQEDSDGVEIFYKFVGHTAPAPAPPPTDPIDPTGPSSNGTSSGLPTTDGYEHVFSTKASFVQQLALNDIGKTMHVYARWVNTSDPSKNGPFSMVSTLVVS